MPKLKTRIVSFNAHVGLGLKSNGLRWLLNRNPLTTLVFIQEGRFVNLLKRNLGRRFKHFPSSQPGSNGQEAMTYVAWLRVRYGFVDGWNFNIRNGGQYPRRLTAVLLKDRFTSKLVLAVSVHPDPMGKGWNAPRGVVTVHQKQMNEYFKFIRTIQAKYPGVRVVVAGDVNEDLNDDVPNQYKEKSALHGFRALGLKPAHLGKLDGIWTSTGGDGRAVHVPRDGMDHPATVGQSNL